MAHLQPCGSIQPGVSKTFAYGLVGMLLCASMNVAAQPSQVWKKLRAQGFHNEEGQSIPSALQLDLTQARRARLRFTLEPSDRHAVEAAGFTVIAESGGLDILAKGSLLVSSSRQGTARDADSFELLLLRDGKVAYSTSWNTSELVRRDGPWPSISPGKGAQGRAVLGQTVEPSFQLDSSSAKRVRIRFALQPNIPTAVECDGFTVTTSRDGLKIATAGKAIVSSTAKTGRTEAESLELWLSPGGGVGYRSIGASVTR
jgi:hypothetical protein